MVVEKKSYLTPGIDTERTAPPQAYACDVWNAKASNGPWGGNITVQPIIYHCD